MKKRIALLLLALLWITAGMVLSPKARAAAPEAVPAQITFVFPTSTRTPTPINVGNFVWDDIDADGRQDAGEPGLAGVQVQLWNAAKTQLYGSAVTNASGIYTLIAPTPGDYRVRVVLPAAGDSISPKDSTGDDQNDNDVNPSGVNLGFTDTYTFASNLISITTIDIGIVKFRLPTPTRTPTPINLGNFVWHDLNGNGIQEGGEPGISGVTLQLWNSTKTQLIVSTISNASGSYSLIAPVPGDYRIRVLLPGGAGFAPANQGGNDLQDSDIQPSGVNLGFTDPFTIASNVISITSIDAGLVSGVPFATATPVASATPEFFETNKIFLPLLQY